MSTIKNLALCAITVALMVDLIPMSGHPTGYYMASQIARTQGLTALSMDSGNPFVFFYRYNEAASTANEIAGLSPAAIKLIKQLEQKYNRRP